jgi:hypothetical protein
VILSTERAKLSYRWRSSVVNRWATFRGRLLRSDDGRPYTVPCCPACFAQVLDEDGVPLAVDQLGIAFPRWTKLQSTSSNVRALPAEAQAALLDLGRKAIEDRGGTHTLSMDTVLFIAVHLRRGMSKGSREPVDVVHRRVDQLHQSPFEPGSNGTRANDVDLPGVRFVIVRMA